MSFKTYTELVVSEISQVFNRMDDASIRPLLESIKAHRRIFLLGGGREGLATRAFAMRLMHLGKEAHWIWDDTTPSIGKGDLMICACGSADVGHENHIVRLAKEAGGTVALLTAAQSGFLTRYADVVTIVPAHAYRATGDFVKSEQLMGNLFEQILFLLYDILVMLLREELAIPRDEMVARHRNVE
ncbi:MAG: SIS domain-containing protein [Clostridia bacterium]|nr:SIS domain-containing protein [Clostridia bacterium]